MVKRNKSRQMLLSVVYIAIGCVAAYFLFPPLISVFAPFIIAYVIAAMIEPLVRLLTGRLKIPRGIASGISVFLTIFIVGGLTYYIVFRIVAGIKHISDNWPAISAQAEAQMSMYKESIMNYYYSLPVETQSMLSTAYETTKDNITSMFKPIVDSSIKFATNFAAGIPSGIIFFIVMFLAAYFISSQRSESRELSKKIFGTAAAQRIAAVIRDLKHALGGYVKAQLIIMSIVFVVLSIGLGIMGAPYFIVAALFIAVFDALPVLGSGGILVPWSIIAFISGDIRSGIIALVMYFAVLAVRQSLEPKIIGHHIGVPPLITLVAMYAGLRFFGILGMIFGPILVLIVKNLYEAGVFDKMLGIRRRAEAVHAEPDIEQGKE